MSVCWILHTFVPIFMHLEPPPVLYSCLSAKPRQKRNFAPSTHPQSNEPVPQVLKHVVNLSCLFSDTDTADTFQRGLDDLEIFSSEWGAELGKLDASMIRYNQVLSVLSASI